MRNRDEVLHPSPLQVYPFRPRGIWRSGRDSVYFSAGMFQAILASRPRSSGLL